MPSFQKIRNIWVNCSVYRKISWMRCFCFLIKCPHLFEPYMKAFQYKVLNSILFTNTKLCKLGYIPDDKCSFCKSEPESLNHVFFNCRHARHFWKEFERYYYSLTREFVHLTLKDVIQYWDNKRTMPLAKLFDTDCKILYQAFLRITAFKPKLKMKYEIVKFICIKTCNMEKFNKWALSLGSAP